VHIQTKECGFFSHEIASSGGYHTASGLTAGHVLRATGATSFVFGALQAGDLPTGIDAAKIADGSVSNIEFQYLDDYSSIGLKDLTSSEVDQLENIGTTTISAAQWEYLGLLDQGLAQADSPIFSGLTVNGNIAVTGTVDGVDVSDLSTSFLAHKNRHDPQDGEDPLDCAAPLEISGVVASSEGSAHSFARSDHVHAVNHGITDNHIVTIDHVAVAVADYARFTANGLEGRSPAEVLSDIDGAASGHLHDDRYYTETEIDTWRNSVTQAEMGYLHGVTSDIQTQLDGKEAAGISVLETDFNADTFLYASADNTPLPVSPADVLAALSGHAEAAFNWNSQDLTGVNTISATTAKLSDLTDGYLPYHASDAAGLANSGLYWNSANSRLGIGTASPTAVDGGVVAQISSATGADLILERLDASIEDNDFVGGVAFKNIDTSGTPPHYAGIKARANSAYGSMDLEFYAGRDKYENDTPHIIILGYQTEGYVGIGVIPNQKLTVEGTISLKEQANANADTAGYGQLWVKNTTPCELWFTDDAGNDSQLTGDTSRSLWLPFNALKAPGTKAATFKDWGISGVWEFSDGTDDTIVFNIQTPYDMDINTAPSLLIGWSTSTTVTTETAVWQLEYLWTSEGEDTTAAAQETLTVNSNAIAQANGLIIAEITGIDLPGATDACMHCRVKRLGANANDDLTDTAELHGICFKYTSI